MGDMPMPGGATTSIVMSMLMMAAMMLPSSALLLRRDRQAAARRGETRLVWRTAIVGAGYFLVWIAIGAAAAPIGDALAHAGRLASGLIVLGASAFQFSSWKTQELGCLQQQVGGTGAPFRRGLRLGIHCARCCGNLMAVLLVIGAMNLTAMAVVTMAITLERAMPAVARGNRVKASASRRACDRPADVNACVSARTA